MIRAAAAKRLAQTLFPHDTGMLIDLAASLIQAHVREDEMEQQQEDKAALNNVVPPGSCISFPQKGNREK